MSEMDSTSYRMVPRPHDRLPSSLRPLSVLGLCLVLGATILACDSSETETGVGGTSGGYAGTGGTGGTEPNGGGTTSLGGSTSSTTGGGAGGEEPEDIGTFHDTMWNTYYYFADESDYPEADSVTIYDADCEPIAQVPATFSDDVCIEGSGILEDGTVINYASTCSCGGPTCPYGSEPEICYVVLDPQEYPWGMGSFSNPLEPLRSWAVDNDFIPAGSLIYAAEWDGVAIPAIDGIGDFVHDGCFRADDVGGAIDGDHYDFFAGTRDMYLALEEVYPTGSTFDVYLSPGKCAYLAL